MKIFSVRTLISGSYLHDFAKRLEFGLGLLEFLLLLFVFWQLETFLGDADQILAIVFAQLLDTVLINGLAHVEHFKATLGDALDKGRILDDLDRLARDKVDVLLVVL